VGGGVGNGSTAPVDRVFDQRWNLLMFPEGTRSRDGEIHKLRSGAAAIAQQHGIPIVPIYVEGTHDAMPPGRNWPKKRWLLGRRHRLEVHFGAPIWPRPDEHRSEVMARVRGFMEAAAGLEPTPAPTPAPATVAERPPAPVV
jgi:1-acyl-sn-glycerol-3-phosphate acyltransferase